MKLMNPVKFSAHLRVEGTLHISEENLQKARDEHEGAGEEFIVQQAAYLEWYKILYHVSNLPGDAFIDHLELIDEEE